jgi:hypothetical protein
MLNIKHAEDRGSVICHRHILKLVLPGSLRKGQINLLQCHQQAFYQDQQGLMMTLQHLQSQHKQELALVAWRGHEAVASSDSYSAIDLLTN